MLGRRECMRTPLKFDGDVDYFTVPARLPRTGKGTVARTARLLASNLYGRRGDKGHKLLNTESAMAKSIGLVAALLSAFSFVAGGLALFWRS